MLFDIIFSEQIEVTCAILKRLLQVLPPEVMVQRFSEYLWRALSHPVPAVRHMCLVEVLKKSQRIFVWLKYVFFLLKYIVHNYWRYLYLFSLKMCKADDVYIQTKWYDYRQYVFLLKIENCIELIFLIRHVNSEVHFFILRGINFLK